MINAGRHEPTEELHTTGVEQAVKCRECRGLVELQGRPAYLPYYVLTQRKRGVRFMYHECVRSWSVGPLA